MDLDLAERYARQIVNWLSPFCERIEIAGSVRRGRPVCNDIHETKTTSPNLLNVSIATLLFQDHIVGENDDTTSEMSGNATLLVPGVIIGDPPRAVSPLQEGFSKQRN